MRHQVDQITLEVSNAERHGSVVGCRVRFPRLFQLAAYALILLAALGAATSPASAKAQDNTEPDFAIIDRYVDEQRQAQRVPGIALGIVRDGEVVHLRGFGTADASGRAVTPQTPFIVGSLTKSFTAVAVMQLVEAGKLDLDAPVQRYLTWFRVADAEASARITVRHLLYQTSGLSARVGDVGIVSDDQGDEALESEVRALGTVQLNRPVGATHEYSNANYSTLGLLVQTAAGQSYEDYVERHILRALGMQRSFTSKDAARLHGLASGHRYWFGVPVPADLPYPRGVLPAGYLISTVEDMARYLTAYQRALLQGDTTLLSSAGMAELLRPGAEAGSPDAHYAMGWGVMQDGDVRVIGHSGETLDFRSSMSLVPERGLGMVVLMNADTALDRGRLRGIAEGAHTLLLSREAPTAKSSSAVLVVYGVLLAVVAVQAAGMVRTTVLLRRWRRRPEPRPRGRWALTRHLGLPVLANVSWAAVTLLLLPQLFGGSLALMTLQVPDIGYIVVASGAVALAWTFLRTALALDALGVAPWTGRLPRTFRATPDKRGNSETALRPARPAARSGG